MTSKEVLGRKGNEKVTADVVVIGGGPGGSVAAKNCAQRGMRTLLLEKQKLPRRKVCTGLIVSNMAHALIDREFGVIPQEVLTDPPHLLGYMWHISGFDDKRREMPPRLTNVWRSNLDYWMNQKTKQAGAEIWEGTLVTDVIQQGDEITLKVKRFKEEQEIRAGFVIGADGAASVTRKALFPNLNLRYIAANDECHPGALDLDRRYWHLFGSRSSRTAPYIHWFSVIHKKDCFVICASNRARPIPVREAMSSAKNILAEKWGFDPHSEPFWTDGTAMPILGPDLHSGKFLPAKGNVLLVGDAAGIVTPSGVAKAGGEGINMALKSGLLASSAIIKAADTSRKAVSLYLTGLQPLIEVCRTLATDYDYYQTNWTERQKLLDKLI